MRRGIGGRRYRTVVMNNRAFVTLLNIEILLIILLICCLAIFGVWSSGRRRNTQPPPVAPTRARQQTSSPVERQSKRPVSRAVAVSRPSSERGKPLPQPAAEPGIIGLASYYQDVFHGHQTASGERYDMAQLTAAHREYPFGTCVRVTNLRNGRQVTVRINDRGPEDRARLLDLSGEAARTLGLQGDGVAKVRLDIER